MSRDKWTPREATLFDWLVALGLFVAAGALLLLTDDMGFPRDETFYFHAANDYAGWFKELLTNYRAGELWKSFTKANVDSHWSYNTEHPVLMKSLFAISKIAFHHKLEWLDPRLAMRLPGMATGAGCVALTYLFARQTFGRVAGIAAGLALFFQPRFFFHAHLACFDVPITFFWLATTYAYWRSLDSKRWALATGLLWGLALCTKLNAFFLPIVLTGHWLLTNWKGFGLRRTERGWSVDLPPMPWALVSMAILGPIVFYALTPRYWFNTFNRVSSYIGFHLHHVNYFVYYFGQDVQHPPLPVSYPLVMTVVTVPAIVLIAAGFGFVHAALEWDPVDWGKRWLASIRALSVPSRSAGDPRGTGLLLAINLVFPIALISMPETPIFGGTKHWMPAMPFLAIFTGAGVALAVQLFVARYLDDTQVWKRTVGKAAVAVLLVASVGIPSAKATFHVHPFGTSYYNTFIGSIRGAADHRMFRQFWGYASRQALPWLRKNAKKNARVWTHNTTGWGWWHYGDLGFVRDDMRTSGLKGSDYALYHHQKAFVFKAMDVWQRYDTYTPAHVVSLEGVPLLSVYRRPDLMDAKAPGPDPDQPEEDGNGQADDK